MTRVALDDRDGPRDECGVFGVYAPESDVARLAYFALYALQHRGQESAGIATTEAGHIMTVRDLGLVSQVFDEEKLRALDGEMAIGHVRYSTTGSSAWENAQPVWRSDERQVALAHNGNLINAVELHAALSEQGVQFRGTSDSEIIAALLSTHPAERIEDALAEVMPRLEGAYSTVVMTKDAVVGFRDPAGVRPLSLGQLGDRYCLASESCAFDIIGAELLREVQPGEMISLGPGGIETRQLVESERKAFCVFEHIYFARPDSILEGNRTQVSRRKMGEILFRESPVEADVVIAVPDSGNAAATGYSKASGIPRDDGLIKNRYVARTFIQPGQELRKHGLRMKFNPLREVVAGKRLVVVDDSIVRGNTTRQIVQMLRGAGAAEIHMRISAPPIRHPCHYGIDMSTTQEMVAHGRTEAEIAEELDCDSLAYLSLDGVYEAIRSSRDTHCDACFSGATRSPAPTPRTASSRWRSWRSCAADGNKRASFGVLEVWTTTHAWTESSRCSWTVSSTASVPPSSRPGPSWPTGLRLRAPVASSCKRRPPRLRRRSSCGDGSTRLAPCRAPAPALAAVGRARRAGCRCGARAGSDDSGGGGPTVDGVLADTGRAPAAAVSPRGGPLLPVEVEGVRFPDYEEKFGWRAVGQRDDEIDGRKVRTVVYARGRDRVTYSIVAGDALAEPSGRDIAAEGTRLRVIGDGAVTWRRLGHTCVMEGPALRTVAELAGWTAKGKVVF